MPQEFNFNPHEPNIEILINQAGYFGIARTEAKIQAEKLLKKMELWDRRFDVAQSLSGGMKRRVLIAKALSHEPTVLFLDEPSASVDVELRKDMWEIVKRLKQKGVTIILTTHYIEEAEEIADRVGIINHGKIIVVDQKDELIKRLGEKKLILELQETINNIPTILQEFNLELSEDKKRITYTYDTKNKRTGITTLLNLMRDEGINLKDMNTEKSSLESIFINLVKGSNNELLRS